ncbi:hypothetical protein H4S03_005439, partial [Coemansia sp. S3946]
MSLRLLGRTVAARTVARPSIGLKIRHLQSSVPDSSGFSGHDNTKNNTNLEILDLALTKVHDLG